MKLRKGENISMSDRLKEVSALRISIEWEWKESLASIPDVDASLFRLGNGGKIKEDGDFIFYNNGIDPERSIIHMGKNLDQIGEESFKIQFTKIPRHVSRLVLCFTLHGHHNIQETLKDVLTKLVLRVGNFENAAESFFEFDLSKEVESETAIMMGEFYDHDGNWKFRAIAQGFNGGLKALAQHFGVGLESEGESLAAEHSDDQNTEDSGKEKRSRTSPKKIIEEQKDELRKRMIAFLPQIQSAVTRQLNESGTRMVIDRFLIEILMYRMEEIKNEDSIKGKKADYVLMHEGRDFLVVEAKKIGAKLNERQIFQATSYGAHAGIKWALLTNLTCWRLYRISSCDGKISSNLVFDVNVIDKLGDETLHCLYLISRQGISRKGLLEALWVKANSLSPESLMTILLSEEFVAKIRSALNREHGGKLKDDEVRCAVERLIPDADHSGEPN